MRQVVIGLSGHIDHGKTTLVKALTGVNTERYDEEIKRGMTIDIGFAFFNESITLIDVPGHEKFVKNMMAGVSGIDAALLIVAADDGVMPQTREHFEIIKLLDIRIGAIVINKIDLSDPEWLELVELDIQELVSGSFLEDAPIHKISAINNTGIDNLRETIIKMGDSVPARQSRGIFRLPVDRVFSIKGFGTVVTGTVNSGSVKVGDSLEILPGNQIAKIRGLQSHTEPVNSVNMGDRAAINLQGIDLEEVSRGSQLVTQNHFQPLQVLGAEVQLLTSSPHPIVQNQRVRIHLGTQEVMARIALVDQKIIEPGEKVASVIRLESPLIAAYSDKFIIRQYSPVITVGGGEVIETEMSGKWKIIKEKISKLNNVPSSDRLHHKVYQEFSRPIKKADIGLRLGLSMEMINELVENDIRLHWGKLKNNTWLLSDSQINELEIAIVGYLKEYHKKNVYKVGAQKEEIRQALHCEPAFLEFLLNKMAEKECIKSQGESWSLIDHNILLSPEEKDIQDKLIEILDTEGFTSSRYDELASQIGYDKEKVKILLNISQQSGEILRLDGNLMFTRGNFNALKKKVNIFFKDAEVMSVPEFKDLAGTSRKYAVPLLEYFDKLNITYRDNDGRKLVK